MSQALIEVIAEESTPTTTVVRVSGILDSACYEIINKTCAEIIDRYPTFVVAEMSGVTLFSSSILGCFMGWRKRLAEKNGDLVFTGLNLDIKTKLGLLGANKIFKLFNNVRSAINSYKWEHDGVGEKVRLSFPSQLRFVPAVRQFVSRIAQQKGYSHRDSFRIETIVDEVCNNAVEHGAQGSDKNVDIFIGIDRAKIELQVVNQSNPEKIDHLKDLAKSVSKAAGTDLERKRGRGIGLIKMLSNDLSLDFSNGGTSVHVTRLRSE